MRGMFDPYQQWLNISSAEQPPNHYRLLGLPLLEANLEKIRQACSQRLSLLKRHADGPHASAAKKLGSEVVQVAACLTDPKRKAAYDATLRQLVLGGESAGSGDPLAPRPKEAAPVEDLLQEEFSDLSIPLPSSDSSVRASRPGRLRKKSPARATSKSRALLAGSITALLAATALAGALVFLLSDGKQPASTEQHAEAARRRPPTGSWQQTSTAGRSGKSGRDSAPPQHTAGTDRSSQQPAKPSNSQGTASNVASGSNEASGSRPTSPPGAVPPRDRQRTNEQQAEQMIVRVQRSVVDVVATIPEGEARGSGFLVAGGKYVVTNYHVIENAATVRVQLHDGRTAPITEYAPVRNRDLAILLLHCSNPPPGLTLRSDLPKAGETVYALGSPLGLHGTVTDGIVSSVRTAAEISSATSGPLEFAPESRWVQTSAPISQGNSGGPLVDAAGRVVGVNTWHYRSGQNLNFALSAVEVQAALAQPVFVAFHPTSGRTRPSSSVPGSMPRQPTNSVSRSFSALHLPGGQSLTADMVRPPSDLDPWVRNSQTFFASLIENLADLEKVQSLLKKTKCPCFPLVGSDGKPVAVAGFHKALLHGRVAWFYVGEGRLGVLGHYNKGKRDGNFVLYAADGRPMWFGQFRNNVKSGLIAWFASNGQPIWVEVWDLGKRRGEYCVQRSQQSLEVKNPGDVSDQQVVENARETVAKVSEIFLVWEKEETELRRVVADLFREINFRIKRNRATLRNLEARQAMLKRIRSHSTSKTIGAMQSFAERARAAGW